MTSTSSPRTRAFTLLELAVGIALSGIVLGAVSAMYAAVLSGQARQKAFSELARDGEFVGGLLTNDLRQAGLGVPSGNHIMIDKNAAGTVSDAMYGTLKPGTASSFAARRIILARPNAVGMVGDLPRPDANYPAFGPLHNRVTGAPRDSLAWSNENNGTCIPGACDPRQASMFFPNDGSAACAAGAVGARTCPWGLRRVVARDRLQIVDGNGNWAHTGTGGALAAVSNAAHNNVLSLTVTPAFDLSVLTGDANDEVWINTAAADGPGGILGQGWVTSLDRAYYVLSGTNIVRTQCWGDPDPEAPGWPPSTVNNLPGSFAVNAAVTGPVSTTPNICVGPEIVARNVQSLTFSYFDATGNVVVAFPDGNAKNSVVDVRWNIVFQQTQNVGPAPVNYTVTGAARLQN